MGKDNSNQLLFGLLMVAVVIVIAGTLVSIDSMKDVVISGQTLTGAVAADQPNPVNSASKEKEVNQSFLD
tara:strand:- start:162 stop:371 length:210 start_codon:yes stop_codon:yes gene_type:complete